MKTKYASKELEAFITTKYDLMAGSLTPLQEGHSAQVFKFDDVNGRTLVIRIRKGMKDLQADRYAYNHFISSTVPIPKVLDIGLINQNYFAISEYIEGKQAFGLIESEFSEALPAIQDALGAIYTTDISSTRGYGDINPELGNGPFLSWKSRLENEIDEIGGVKMLEEYAKRLHLASEGVAKLFAKIHSNIDNVSETRRLLHGDPGYDNMLISGGKVVAVLDWEQMAFGDWARDFSRLPSVYGDIYKFAEKYGLETNNISERVSVYRSINMLRDIEFAVSNNDESIAERLRKKLRKM